MTRNQQDENIAFLYLCLIHSDYKQINFNEVARLIGINPPAARMRFTRLRKTAEQASESAFAVSTKDPRAPKSRKKQLAAVSEDDDECSEKKPKLQPKRPRGRPRREVKVEVKTEVEKEEMGERSKIVENQIGAKRDCSPPLIVKKEEEPLLYNLYDVSDDEPVVKKRRMDPEAYSTLHINNEVDGELWKAEEQFGVRDTVEFLTPFVQAYGVGSVNQQESALQQEDNGRRVSAWQLPVEC